MITDPLEEKTAYQNLIVGARVYVKCYELYMI